MDLREPVTDRPASGAVAAPPPRSGSALGQRRSPLPWPREKQFRVLSLDGGGIRGLFSASFLAGIEDRYLGGRSIADYFDLITGTSTGGIIALGLGAGRCAADLRDLYLQRGAEIFPPPGLWGRMAGPLRKCIRYRYDREALRASLSEVLGPTPLGQSRARLVVPSVDGGYGDLYLFRTPHHPDLVLDRRESMVKVALATSAAPSYFRPLDDGGYTFLDGGVWANNPVMVGLVDVLSCFDVDRARIRILSVGCGAPGFRVTSRQRTSGGLLHWRHIFDAATHFQSLSALGQAKLLLGAPAVVRIDVESEIEEIALDDSVRASRDLPSAASTAIETHGERVFSTFLTEPAASYRPSMPKRVLPPQDDPQEVMP